MVYKIKRMAQDLTKKEKGFAELLSIGKDKIHSVDINGEHWQAVLLHKGPTVYVIQCEKYYKIGITERSIVDRMNDMQTYTPFKLNLVLALKDPNAKDTEKKIHMRFKHKRIRGEWFEFTLEDFSILESFVLDLWKKTKI